MPSKKLLEFIITFGFIGKIKFARRIFIVLATVLFMWFLFSLSTMIIFLFERATISKILRFSAIGIPILLFLGGVISISSYIKNYPDELHLNEIAIDKVFGQILTYNLIPIIKRLIGIGKYQLVFAQNFVIFTTGSFVLTIILFQIFDAKKPWPTKWLNNNIKGGLRIMLDGLLAAVFASIAFCGIFFGVLNFL